MEIKHVFKGYNYFYKKIYGTHITLTSQNEKLCITFLELLKKKYLTLEGLGEDYLWNYFVYQFSYWSRLEIKSFNKKINLSFIIGGKALSRFLERDIQYDWQIAEKEREYDRSEFNSTIKLSEKIASNYDADEIYRQMNLNAENGLSTCLTYTSLFNKISSTCQSCLHAKDCVEVQKELYPKIYKNRITENESRTTRQ